MKKINIKNFFAIIIIIAISLFYNLRYLNEFPSHIHAWAQSDRYALSLGFVDNGYNLFEPQTYVYNQQFPTKYTVPSKRTITSVDFPVHDYIPALIMGITGNTSPAIFRLYILLYSMAGLYFLYKLGYKVCGNYYSSVLIVLFAATSPLFVYYQGGFLPTIPSLSNTIAGVYFFYLFISERRYLFYNLGILFFTIATLARTTFAIALVAVICIEIIRVFRKEDKLLRVTVPVLLSVTVIIAYKVYNCYLLNEYGSMFLTHILPAKSWAEAVNILKYIANNWILQYFTAYHYLGFILAICTASSVFYKKNRYNIYKLSYFSLFVITTLIGCLLFFILMLKQFFAHDYYFLDSFFLPFILILILAVKVILQSDNRILIMFSIIMSVFLAAILWVQPLKSQVSRRISGPWDKTEETIKNFDGSAAYLDSLNIPGSSKILVMDAVAPNIPFIKMQRKGFVVMETSAENIEKSLKWDFDYIIFQNEYFISDIYTQYPGILSRIIKVSDNGKLLICRLSDTLVSQTLPEFFGINTQKALFNSMITFEDKPDSTIWKNIHKSNKHSPSGSYAGYLSKKEEYSTIFKTSDLRAIFTRPSKLFFNAALFSEDLHLNCQLVVSVVSEGNTVYYKSYNLEDLIKTKDKWQEVSLLFQLPAMKNNSEVAVYIWNNMKSCELFYDDLSVKIY